MEEHIGLLPSCWGPTAWTFIHSVAFAYNPKDYKNFYNFFMTLGTILPCKECREHYYQHLDKNELMNALETNEGLFRWTYNFHNKVNKSLGIPESEWPSYETVWERYNSFKSDCSQVEGACSASVNKKKITVKIIDEDETDHEVFYYRLFLIVVSILLLLSLGYIFFSKKR